MPGLTIPDTYHTHAHRSDATRFMVVQVGVCPFVWKQKSQTWLASPFNFYVFPCEFRGIDRRFMCQTRCMQFLANNSLDFNKLFKSGVPFLNHQEVTPHTHTPRCRGPERTHAKGRILGRAIQHVPLCVFMLMRACARAHRARRRS